MTYQYLKQFGKEYLKNFDKYVLPEPNSGCWLWLGYLTKLGYGRFNPKYKTSPLFAHRVSYEIYKGPIPDGLHIDHLCRVPCCVNPDHLEAVTPYENLLRGIGTPGRNYKLKTHCKAGHPFSSGDFYVRGRTKICLICDRKRNREKYKRNRLAGKPK